MNQLLLPAPSSSNGSDALVKAGPSIDLLSGDDYNSPKADTSLALVPVGDQQPASPLSQQNALVLFDMFSNGNNVPTPVSTQPIQPTNVNGQFSPLAQQVQLQQTVLSPQGGFYPNGSGPNVGSPLYEQSPFSQSMGPAWNGQVAQQQQPQSPAYGSPNASFIFFN